MAEPIDTQTGDAGAFKLKDTNDPTQTSSENTFMNSQGSDPGPMAGTLKSRAPKEVREFTTKKFFCLRGGNFEHAVEDIQQYIDESRDGKFLSAWLLTEIDHWDHEKERMVILTDKQLLVFKYNFISLRIEDCRRVALQQVDKIQSGKFVYPKNSLMTPRESQNGIRVHWDKRRILTLWQRWSPFFNEAPFLTFTQHKVVPFLDKIPPYMLYQDFKQALIHAMEDIGSTFDSADEPIVMEVYVGLVSVMHNSSHLGFSKDRGNVSF